MNPELFDSYRLDRQDIAIEGFALEALPHLRRHLPAEGEALLCFTRLTPGQELAQVREQIAHFSALRRDFEWKVYELDQPANLKSMLEAEGFVADESEVFMLYPLQRKPETREALAAQSLPAGVELRRITDAAQLPDVLRVQELIWGRNFDWLHDKLAASLAQPDAMSMFCAYAEGQPIGTGWTDYPPGSRYPELHGGAVLPEWRGRGVYSALFQVRFEEARARGFDWMAVDASPMSHPILLAMGFLPVCMTWPLRYRQPASA
mgnify:CR=1 FL=1